MTFLPFASHTYILCIIHYGVGRINHVSSEFEGLSNIEWGPRII